ncbi:MAG: hypothetical protein CME26_15590 [Gemmatimonadetes bacterium]|nr:hypothetical protein [Gemmatimonadota bacterium]|tara:strand:+ start:1666 stop:2220 length:555 start_codon:yes stop_codon:yes gene_type:complete
MSKRLLSRSNLDQLRNQAKDLLKSCRKSSSDAIGRFRTSHPSLTDPDPETFGDRVGLQDAQLVTVREYGFQSWRALGARVAETEHRQVLIDHIHANRQQEAIDVLRTHGFIEEDLTLALARAACYSRFEVADALIERGADPSGDYPGGNFGPILLAACEFLNPDGIRYLVEQGARVNIPERDTA